MGQTVTLRMSVPEDSAVFRLRIDALSFQRSAPLSDVALPDPVLLLHGGAVAAAAAASGLRYNASASHGPVATAAFAPFAVPADGSGAFPLADNDTWAGVLTGFGTLLCADPTSAVAAAAAGSPRLRRLTGSPCSTVGHEAVVAFARVTFDGSVFVGGADADNGGNGGSGGSGDTGLNANHVNKAIVIGSVIIAALSAIIVVLGLTVRHRQQQQEQEWEDAQARPAVPDTLPAQEASSNDAAAHGADRTSDVDTGAEGDEESAVDAGVMSTDEFTAAMVHPEEERKAEPVAPCASEPRFAVRTGVAGLLADRRARRASADSRHMTSDTDGVEDRRSRRRSTASPARQPTARPPLPQSSRR